MSTMNCRRSVAAMSKHGSRRPPATAGGARVGGGDSGGAVQTRSDPGADEPVPKRLEIERLMRQPRKWIYGAIAATLVAFIAGGGVRWLARGGAASPRGVPS